MSYPLPRQTLPTASPSLMPLPTSLPTDQKTSPLYLKGPYSAKTPFGQLGGLTKRIGTFKGFVLAGAYPAQITVPLGGAYTEALPGTFRGYTIAGAYPARTSVPLSMVRGNFVDRISGAFPATASVTSQQTMAPPFLSNSIYIVGALSIISVIILIWHFTKKGKYRKAKL